MTQEIQGGNKKQEKAAAWLLCAKTKSNHLLQSSQVPCAEIISTGQLAPRPEAFGTLFFMCKPAKFVRVTRKITANRIL